jgi:hypothetical protein
MRIALDVGMLVVVQNADDDDPYVFQFRTSTNLPEEPQGTAIPDFHIGKD